MTNLCDLVLEVEEAEVREAIARLYNRSETEWLPEAIANVLAQLRKLVPDPAGAEWQLRIELTPPIYPDEQPCWDVSCTKEGDPERYGFDLSPWEEWLAVRVPQSLLEEMTANEIVGHSVWEMTFFGFTQEKIAETRAELECRVKEIDEAKAELIPCEEAKERLREKFGWKKENRR
jgi:Family of unknown function (DUF6557)